MAMEAFLGITFGSTAAVVPSVAHRPLEVSAQERTL
jgi:hypothetical protein